MGSYCVGRGNSNSVFTPLASTGLRHLLYVRISRRVPPVKNGVPHDVYMNLYTLLEDALKYREFWSRLGWSHEDLRRYRQHLNNLSRNLTSHLSDAMLDLKKFVKEITIYFCLVCLLTNGDDMALFNLQLTCHSDLLKLIRKLIHSGEQSERRAARIGKIHVPGLTKPVYTQVLNIITPQDIQEIADYLRQPEQGELVTNLVASHFTGERLSLLSCIPLRRRLFANFYAGNALTSSIIASLYLVSYDIAFLKEVLDSGKDIAQL